MITVNYDNNSGSNYSYIIGEGDLLSVGINLPGSWASWSNPPNISYFASSTQAGGDVFLDTGLAYRHYQTIIPVSSSGSVEGGSYEFLITSGPDSNPNQNKWTDVNVILNQIQSYNFHNDGGGSNNSIALTNDNWYVFNFEDNGYNNSRGIFMEFSSVPAEIDSLYQVPASGITNLDDVDVCIKLSSGVASEQVFVLRYTTDGWLSWDTVMFSMVGLDSAVASIPAMLPGSTVEYYVLSTHSSALSGISSNQDYDLITVNYDNNSGSNYFYTIEEGEIPLSAIYQTGAVYTIPALPLENASVVIYFDATLGNGALAGYEGDVYAHTGVITTESTEPNQWLHIVSEWGENLPKTKFTRIGQDFYKLEISNIREYYDLTDPQEHILQMAMVIRSGEPISSSNPDEFIVAREEDGGDFFLPVYQLNDLVVKFTSPNSLKFLYGPGEHINFSVFALNSEELKLYLDDILILTSSVDSIIYEVLSDTLTQGNHLAVAEAIRGGEIVYDTVRFVVMGEPEVADLPLGVTKGVNFVGDSVIFVLWDPSGLKNYAFVIGDFNDWQADANYYMKRTPDGKYFWLSIGGLADGEYAYQYFIDGRLRLADPYSKKILDPWNDQYIENYPNLIAYPQGKTTGIVSVFEKGAQEYQWQIENFVPVSLNELQPNLTVYELLVRDFTSSSSFNEVINKLDYLKELGIDAIEIMPVIEFEGNISWGYNPSFYFAVDKYYGTSDDFKRLIDECHTRGIAVIMDIVLNHAYGQCPLVQMYWDNTNNCPSVDNPWFNQVATHPLSPGFDFNHESPYTKEFVKDVLRYWLEEYKIDGFRFDLSKGFTQNQTSDISAWSAYDQTRIDILKEYYDYIKSINSNSYVILEHFSDNNEEKVLADYGFLMWQNMNYNFAQNLMGWQDGSDISWSYYQNRGFIYPNNLTFMESHDEERLMYKALQYGNSNGSYDASNLSTAIERSKALAMIFFLVPGPKMLWQFGELGYDYSINYCEDGTINENCRTSPKPVRWDYYNDEERLQLYNTYRKLINLRHDNGIVRQGNYGYSKQGLVQQIWLSSDTLNIYAVANFDVIEQNIDLYFQHVGTWYDLLNDQSIEVSSLPVSKTLSPGEYHLFADKQLNLVDDIVPDDSVANVIDNKDNILIYPIPAQNVLHILGNDIVSVEIISLIGQRVSRKLDHGTINISNLKPGVYILKIKTNNMFYIRKFIKQ